MGEGFLSGKLSLLPPKGTAVFGSPLKWSAPDKCLVVAFPTLVFLLLSAFALSLYEADPSLAPYVDPGAIDPFRSVLLANSVGWLVIIGTSLLLRRRRHRVDGLVHATLQLWHVGYAVACSFVGPLTSPLGGLVLVGPLFGLMLFDARAELWAMVSFVVVAMGAVVLERLALIPYAPLLREAPYVEGRLSENWILTMGTISLLISGFVLLVFWHVIKEWRQGESALTALARTDELTGLDNRRDFIENLDYELARASRYGRPLSLVIVDIDHFKQVNDRHGHAEGDAALVFVADVLKRAVRRQDQVARYGGEEFALLLPETPVPSALVVAERCRTLVEDGGHCLGDGRALALTISVGVAELPSDETIDADELIRRADAALYRAKNAGRNRVEAARRATSGPAEARDQSSALEAE